MGIKASMRINLADAAGFSNVVSAGASRHMGANLFPDPDNSYPLGTGVATLQVSADGENFTNSSSTLSASTTGVFNVDIEGVHSVRFLTTTADGAADPSANISVYFQ